MADLIAVANVGPISAEEDESYLYSEGSQSAPTIREDENSAQLEFVSDDHTVEDEKIGEEQNDEEGEFEESDDDDDNIQVHIGEVNASGTTPGVYGTPVNWKKDATGTVKSAVLPTQGQKKIDVNAVGLINGQPIYEYDMDNDQDDKPWRKPGADISDYFNYGFTEETWKQYCEKQRRMRLETNRGSYVVTTTPSITPAQVEIEVLPDGRTRVKAGPPPDRKVEGSIHVIGSDADARRKQKEDELLALALGSTRVMAPSGFPGQRPIYTALPAGAMMFNPETSQPQQIQSIGGGPSGLPPGLQFLPHVSQSGMQSMSGAPQIFPPPSMTLGDPFLHPGNMVPPGGYSFAAPNHYESDSEYDSDNENRRHRSSRRESSRHRRHRDRSDRDRSDRSDRDRDRSKTRSDRDRSSSRVKREHSKASSDRKKRSSRTVKQEGAEGSEESSERKSRSSRRSKQVIDEPEEKKDVTKDEGPPPSVKQEPVGD